MKTTSWIAIIIAFLPTIAFSLIIENDAAHKLKILMEYNPLTQKNGHSRVCAAVPTIYEGNHIKTTWSSFCGIQKNEKVKFRIIQGLELNSGIAIDCKVPTHPTDQMRISFKYDEQEGDAYCVIK